MSFKEKSVSKKIMLTGGAAAVVDDADHEWLSAMKWHCANGYAVHSVWDKEKKRPASVSMARAIMDAPVGAQVDHINGDRLDNRRRNLRLCTRWENSANRRKPRGANGSRYKGVYRNAYGWWASIRANRKQHYLGSFRKEEDAARAYNSAAVSHFGEFARLNEVE